MTDVADKGGVGRARLPATKLITARNLLAGSFALMTAVAALAALAEGNGRVALFLLLTALATSLLTTQGKAWRTARLKLPGFVIALAVVILLALSGAQMAAKERADADREFARTGEARVSEAISALKAGNAMDAEDRLAPIAEASDPRIRSLTLAAEALLAAKGDRRSAAKHLLARAAEGEEAPAYSAAADYVDASLRKSLEAEIAEDRATAAAGLAEEAAQKKFDRLFSPYDGSVLEVKRVVKHSLNNPASFEHVSTSGALLGNETAAVRMTYRATNGFGAVMTEQVRAVVDLDGKVIALERVR